MTLFGELLIITPDCCFGGVLRYLGEGVDLAGSSVGRGTLGLGARLGPAELGLGDWAGDKKGFLAGASLRLAARASFSLASFSLTDFSMASSRSITLCWGTCELIIRSVDFLTRAHI